MELILLEELNKILAIIRSSQTFTTLHQLSLRVSGHTGLNAEASGIQRVKMHEVQSPEFLLRSIWYIKAMNLINGHIKIKRKLEPYEK